MTFYSSIFFLYYCIFLSLCISTFWLGTFSSFLQLILKMYYNFLFFFSLPRIKNAIYRVFNSLIGCSSIFFIYFSATIYFFYDIIFFIYSVLHLPVSEWKCWGIASHLTMFFFYCCFCFFWSEIKKFCSHRQSMEIQLIFNLMGN